MDRKYFHSGSSLLFHHFNGIFQWTKVFKLSDCWQCLGSLESRLWESLLFKLFIYCPLDQHSWEGGDNKRCLLIINAWGALECILPLRVVRCWDKMTELVYICLNELGFPGGSDGKQSACNAGGPGLISGLGRSPGEGNGNPLQYSSLGKSHGQRTLAGYSPWGRKSQTQQWLSHHIMAKFNSHILIHLFTHLYREGNGNPLQYSCLENSMDGGAW